MVVADASEALPRGRARSSGDRPSRPGNFWSRLGAIALVPIAFYSLAVVAEKTLETYRLRQEANALRAEIEEEKQTNLRLQRELIDARSDQQIEDAARRQLNLIKPGDQAVVLTGPPPPPTPTPRPAVRATAPEEPPEWLTWLLERVGR